MKEIGKMKNLEIQIPSREMLQILKIEPFKTATVMKDEILLNLNILFVHN